VAEIKVANERRYRNLAEAIPQIVWIAASDGAMQYMNARFAELTGVKEYAGYRWHGGVHPDDVDVLRDDWDHAIAEAEPFSVECRLRDTAGQVRWHLCRGIPEKNRDGRLLDWLGTFTDIHEQKLVERS